MAGYVVRKFARRERRNRWSAASSQRNNAIVRTLRHFLFTWFKTQGIDDALI
jgi:hypothetical protein